MSPFWDLVLPILILSMVWFSAGWWAGYHFGFKSGNRDKEKALNELTEICKGKLRELRDHALNGRG
jgi:hypothetical protein